MTIVVKKQTENSITLDQFIAFLDANTDKLDDLASFDGLPRKLQELSNNRSFLIDLFNEGLDDLETFQQKNGYGPQVFMLHQTSAYFIRLNYWPEARAYAHPIDEVDRYFVYGRAHDHNFSFATVGYMGPGYDTDLYTYDYNTVKGLPGESVDINYQGRETLSQGHVLIFRTSKDIHVQLTPTSGSISINVIPVQKPINTQYEFDLEKGRLSGVEKQNNHKKNLSTLLKYFGDTECEQLYIHEFGADQLELNNSNGRSL